MSKAKTEITVAEWLESLAQSEVADDDGYITVAELADHTGRSVPAIRKALRAALDAGRLSVRNVFRTSVCGRSVQVPAYKIVSKSNAEE